MKVIFYCFFCLCALVGRASASYEHIYADAKLRIAVVERVKQKCSADGKEIRLGAKKEITAASHHIRRADLKPELQPQPRLVEAISDQLCSEQRFRRSDFSRIFSSMQGEIYPSNFQEGNNRLQNTDLLPGEDTLDSIETTHEEEEPGLPQSSIAITREDIMVFFAGTLVGFLLNYLSRRQNDIPNTVPSKLRRPEL